VVERCEGNPLFARQLLLEWAERGWLVDQGGLQFELAPNVDASAVLPNDASALFRERTRGLAEASGNPKRFRNALHLAALAGAVLPRALLETLMSDLRDFSIGCGLWKSVGDQMRFDSSMLHQAVRSEAELREDLTTLHRELGRHWQEYSRTTGEDAHLQVGRHAALGEDVSLAISHLLPACEHSWHSGRTRDLEEASARVLGVTSRHEPQSRQHAHACLWRARAFDIRGNTKEAARLFAEAQARDADSGDGAGQSAAHAGLASNAMRGGHLEDAEREFNLAIGTARSAGAASEEALSIYEKGWFEQQKRNFDGAGILFQQALHRLEGMGDDRNAGRALLGLGFIARRTGQFRTRKN
jgi:tetratricopeptide (TPR) repeat protein